MKKLLFAISFLFICSFNGSAQEEVLTPLMYNHVLEKGNQLKTGTNNIDSTFTYIMDTLDVPVWDDFSVNKFEQYNPDFADANVTSVWYYCLMNEFNTVPQDPSLTFCDSVHSRIDTVTVTSGVGVTETSYFTTGQSVWVNDLSSYPVGGELKTLYAECYVLIDSIIDGVPDTDQDTIWFTGAPDSEPDYTQDSAHVFTATINDLDKVWVDNMACHNYRYAVDPWSLGVATFDGVDSVGIPYDFGNTGAHEIADYLTSKHINLAGLTDVYLTFLYQAEGYGNMPEHEDSLIVEFWNADSLAWYSSQWYSNGDGAVVPDVWDTAHIAVPTLFLRNGFRFRFKNYASTSGALDHWHIDYVNLKDNDLPTISNFSDLAIAYPINTLLKDYTSVPWDHFQNATASSKMLDSASLYVYNSDLTATNFADGQMEITYGGILQGGSPFVLPNPGVGGGWTGNWEVGLNDYRYPIAANYSYDQGVTTTPHPQATFDVKVNIDAAVSGSNIYDVNDTTYFQQEFKNYYAYDDGSAEVAYGVSGDHALLAYQFTSYEVDTLTGIAIAFMASVNDLSNKEFLITIWADDGGEPGDIIYQDDYFNTNSPVYGGKNGFHYYEFQDGQSIIVPETFYVGMEQIDQDPLNIGMDMNIDNSEKIFFVNSSGVWVNTSNEASLLIRPVFSTALNYTLSENSVEMPQQDISLYPNPANSIANISGITADFFTVTIYDMSGRVVLVSTDSQFDISELNKGVYLVDVRDENNESLFTEKLIKE